MWFLIPLAFATGCSLTISRSRAEADIQRHGRIKDMDIKGECETENDVQQSIDYFMNKACGSNADKYYKGVTPERGPWCINGLFNVRIVTSCDLPK